MKKFLSLDTKTMLLFLEAFLYLGWARFLLFLPFSKVAPSLGYQTQETPSTQIGANESVLKSVSDAIHVMSHHTFWESQCLVRAIAALKMLESRNIESTLFLGTAKDESGKMIAHAWLRSGPFCITGAEGMEQFTVVGKFVKHASNNGKGRTP